MISQKIDEIRNRIASAAISAGRDAQEIKLVAVAKGQPIEKMRQAIEAGQRDFGENYAQELLAHSEQTGPAPIWHFIGHLQKNKVKQILPLVTLIHSVDSIELARTIDRRAAAIGKTQSILIEINLGGEKTKSGMSLSDVEKQTVEMNALDHVDLQGFMTLPPYDSDPERSRPYFRRLREIRDEMNKKIVYKHALTELSMGMSHDFEIAIEEGATIVRIGTAIFGERQK